ncbi:thiol methyltransferase [Apiospora arundinis]
MAEENTQEQAAQQQPERSLTEHFGNAELSDHPSRWNACWEEEYTPWDRSGPSLALSDLLPFLPPATTLGSQEKPLTALVPGCGRGHDVLLLSSFGFDTVGLDVSERAMAEARKNAESINLDEVYPLKGEAQTRGAYKFMVGDFFKADWVAEAGVEGGEFDLIFDYTFGCALPPSARPAWAQRYRDLLSTTGRLVCLEFPSTKKPEEPGPPWAMNPHTYMAHLGHPGEEVATDEHGGVLEDKVEPPSDNGLIRLLHTKPPRTHAAGYKDGKVVDCISIWCHTAAA